MKPTNALDLVRRLASDEANCEFYKPVLDELSRRQLDTDDLLGIICTEVGETHCYATKQTEKYHPATVSDYFSIWVDDCGERMFLKLLVSKAGDGSDLLVVTSFKKDNRT